LQKAQLQEFQRGQALAARKLGGLADVAIVEADHAEAARGDLLAERVVPQHHLRAQTHDEQHRLRLGVAENVVADVDGVGAGELRRLVGDGGHWSVHLYMSRKRLCGNSIARFAVVQKEFGGTRIGCDKASVLTVPSQRCGMAKKKGTHAPDLEEESRWLT